MSSSPADWEQQEAGPKRWAPFLREREPRSAQSQSHEAWTSFPTMGQGALPFPWAPLPSQTQPRLQHTVNVCTRSLSVTPHEGPQETVRRNEESLVERSVCCPVRRRWQLWDPVPVYPKAPASCTPDSFLHSGLMLLYLAEAGSTWASGWEAIPPLA